MRRNQQILQARQGKQNVFITVTAGRKSVITNLAKDLLFALSSYPSYIIEVFLKKNMGERYFTFSIAVTISLAMLFPWFFRGSIMRDFLGLPWLLFTLAFLVMSIRRRMEIKRFGFAYDFDRFSYSDGEKLHFLYNIVGNKIGSITITRYLVLVLIEPAIPILIGLLLMLSSYTFPVGFLIFSCGILFCYRSVMKAYAARDIILDMIDEQITAKWNHDVIMEEKPQSQTAGLHFPIDLPESKTFRQNFVNSINDDNPLDIWEDDVSENKSFSS